MQQQIEVNFWRGLFNQLGEAGFLELRKKDFEEKTKYFKASKDPLDDALGYDLKAEKGNGLDLGCGLVSIFEFSDIKGVRACDPLLPEYDSIYQSKREKVDYSASSRENLEAYKDGEFDWVFCCNVIDHTPNPKKMVEEIRRVLKPGGRLYFQVNFDDNLSPAHYGLWRKETVDETFGDWTPKAFVVERNEKDLQSIYNAVYVK